MGVGSNVLKARERVGGGGGGTCFRKTGVFVFHCVDVCCRAQCVCVARSENSAI